MGNARDNDWDEEYSVIGDDCEVGFLDFEDDKSLHVFDPLDEGPVVISKPFRFSHGKPQSALVGQTAADRITVRNTTSDPVELWSIRIFSSNPSDSYLLSLMKPPSDMSDESAIQDFVGSTDLEDRVLQPGETLMIWLSCKPEEIGMHTSVVHFDVGDEKIERVAFLLAEDMVSQALASKNPYSRAPRTKQFGLGQYVSGSRPPRAGSHVFKNKLPEFLIPKDIRELVERKQVPDVIMEGLNGTNYANFFSTLLIMEEINLEEEMRRHDMECVTMRRRGNYFLSLEVPGLAERRPSLVYGDFIFAKPATDGPNIDSRPYQGYIHKVGADEIFLKFANELHQLHQDGDLYNVSFAYNRVNMKRLYQAVHAAEKLGPELLFPSKRRVIKVFPLVQLNQNLNREQVHSVEKILGCRGGPPYVIHGPPGTGKTMTVVEAILQLCRSRKDARILVCASSNSAADHVLDKLIGEEEAGLEESKIFRLNATSRPYEDLKTEHVHFCFFEDMVFKCPPLKALLRYRIIICTYMSASLLYSEGIRRGHFTHIFLDEAGQASEPETMIAISNLCHRETVIILAGDPMQLGPVIYSKDAECYGLAKSYLQRLFECQFYENGDQNYVTKLVRNYRCHPAILELPSKLFYKGELIASKAENYSSTYDALDLPNKEFPVLFVGIQGCDEREGSNPSWFNRIEVSKVVELIKKLKKNVELSESDIGVITPYRQQAMKLKNALDSLEMSDVKVGSVEQFQGQEREIIIISTVRSTVKHNEFDRVHNLGFLSNPRRFNVAITRARSLLVIVGNPYIITKDPHWDRLLRHCAENGSYQGCPLPPPEMHNYVDETAGCYGGYVPKPDPNFSGQGDDVPKNDLNEVEWGDDTPNQYTNGADWVEDLSKQRYSEVEWGQDVPQTYMDKDEWCDDIPKQYTGKVELREDGPKQYRDKDEWGDDIPKQFTGEVEQHEVVPKQYTNKDEWGGTDKDEWGDDIPKQYTGKVERHEVVPKQYTKTVERCEVVPKQYRNRDGWGDDIPKQYAKKVERHEVIPKQYSKKVEQREVIPKQYAKKVERREVIPKQYAKKVEQREVIPKQYINKDGWCDDIPKQHIKKVERREVVPESTKDEWGDDIPKQSTNRDEWGGDILKQSTNRDGWGGDIPEQYTSKVERGKVNPNPKQCIDEVELGEDIPKQYTNEVEWDEDIIDQYYKETGWGEDNSKPSYNGSGWGEDNPERLPHEAGWVEFDPKRCSDKLEWHEGNHKRYSNEAVWDEGESSLNAQTTSKAMDKGYNQSDGWN